MQTDLGNFDSDEGYEGIRLDLDNYTDTTYSTHNIHPYPAKFIPQIPKEVINTLSDESDWVLDPFCGSGTTLLEAKLSHRNAIGVDVNPISCLISRAKTTLLTTDDRKEIEGILESIREGIHSGNRYETPEYHNVDYWFQNHVQRELSVIKHHVKSTQNKRVEDFLLTALSAILTKISNQDSDTRYKAIDKDIERHEVWRQFAGQVNDMLQQNRELEHAPETEVRVLNEDIQDVRLPDLDLDLAVTSPPYPNSYDYYLYHKHRMFWLDFDPKDVQEKEFGSRYKHNDKGLGIGDYIEPMETAVEKVSARLRENAPFVIVIGDAILDGELIKMNEVMDGIFAEYAFSKEQEMSFDQRKYTKSFTPNYKDTQKDSYLIIYRNQSES